MMRAALRALGLCATLVVAGCVTPAPDHGAYLQNAKSALESAVSETATARLAVRARLDGRSTNAFADTVVTDSEKALAPIEASFGGVDPPAPEDDTLRTSTLEHLGAASDALAEARVAIRRDDPPALREAEAALAEAVDELEQAREDLG
jgi:hypothetical protein